MDATYSQKTINNFKTKVHVRKHNYLTNYVELPWKQCLKTRSAMLLCISRRVYFPQWKEEFLLSLFESVHQIVIYFRIAASNGQMDLNYLPSIMGCQHYVIHSIIWPMWKQLLLNVLNQGWGRLSNLLERDLLDGYVSLNLKFINF